MKISQNEVCMIELKLFCGNICNHQWYYQKNRRVNQSIKKFEKQFKPMENTFNISPRNSDKKKENSQNLPGTRMRK